MPIFVKNFIWKQTDNIIYIQIPLKGVPLNKADVFISEKFLKLHYPPFLFEVYLLHKINEKDAVCKFVETDVLLELPKLECNHWESLEGSYDKIEKLHLKNLAIEEVQIKTRKMLDEKIKKKGEFNKFLIGKAMEDDSKNLEKVKIIRENQKDSVMKDFEKWRNVTETKTTDKSLNTTSNKQCLKVSKENIQKVINIENKSTIKKFDIPPLRQGGTLNISFTERVFPTPSRESSENNEQVWLKKMNEARKASGFISEDLRPEERDPQWCKDKGDELFRYGNFIGAINAYTHGIKLSDKLPSLYSNRAAAHYALGNFSRCVEDCSAALELLEPKCEANLKSRVACIVRRAAGLTRIGMLSKAIDEMKYAVKLQPNDERLKADLWGMERAWEQDPDSD